MELKISDAINASGITPYSKEEIIRNFIKFLHMGVSYTQNTGEDLAITFLGCVDGEADELPPFRLIPIYNGVSYDDIAGALHDSIFLNRSDLINHESMDNGNYDYFRTLLIKKVQHLIQCYDNSVEKISKDDFIIEMCKLIDFGFDGIRFELKAIGSEEDIAYYIEMGEEHYYPVDGAENIAGNLSEFYREYSAVNSRNL